MKVSVLATTVSGLATTVSELSTEVSEIKTEMDGKFAAVDEEFKTLSELINQRFTAEGEARRRELDDTLNRRFMAEGEAMRRYVDERITSEHEATRRHFDVVAEKIVGERNLALDRSMTTAQQLLGLTASNAGDHARFERRRDDHDRRLEKIEGRHETDPS